MTNLELIDRLCNVINAQSEIIKKQAFYINEITTVDDAVKDILAAERTDVENTVDFLEMNMRTIHSTPTH